ncbi:MAG: ABC transporter permease, partial [Terriglobales bacterium]
MWSELRHALRFLARAPGFTAVALLTLALGIGANTALFTLVNAVLLRELPVGHPGQLALLTDPTAMGMGYGTSGGRRGRLAYPEYRRLRQDDQAFTGLLAAGSISNQDSLVWGQGALERARIKLVSNNYFSVLEVPAFHGRYFDPAESPAPGSEPLAVMSYGYWSRRFARGPAVLGRTFRMLGHVYTVIGITPPGFHGENVGDAPDLYLPLAMANAASPGMDLLHNPPGVSRAMWLQVMGRLKLGVTLAQAQAASNGIFHRLVAAQAVAAADAQSRRSILSQKLELSPGARGTSGLRGGFGDPLLALFALVGLLLVLAIVNLASLLLARASARHKEMGVRLALGAGPGRVLRQLLTESLVLSIAGGLAGAGLAVWGDRLLLRMVGSMGPGIPVQLNLAPDGRVLGFIAFLCIASGVLFGLAPAWRLARLDINAALQTGGRGGAARSRHVLDQ